MGGDLNGGNGIECRVVVRLSCNINNIGDDLPAGQYMVRLTRIGMWLVKYAVK
jgi:hypothetical protein